MRTDLAKKAFIKTIPVLVGYLFLGFGYGALWTQKGYSVWFTLFMSAVMYGGAMQYAMVDMCASDASFFTVGLNSFIINARHMFYGVSLMDKFSGTGLMKPYLIHAMSDETYALLCGDLSEVESKDVGKFCFFVSLFDHLYWIAGGFIGGLVGALVPFQLKGLEFTLTALFVVAMTDQVVNAKNKLPSVIGFSTALLCLMIFPKGYFMIPSMAVILVLLLLLRKQIDGEGKAL